MTTHFDIAGPAARCLGQAGVERFPAAFFPGARYDAAIPVIDLPEELQRKERGITANPLNPIFREVGINHLKSRPRSRPDVAARHYPDLLKAS